MQLTLPWASSPEPGPVDDAAGERVTFVRHRWARRYIVRVLPDGSVRVTLPWRGLKRDAVAFLEKSRGWIARQREALRTRPRAFEPGAVDELKARARQELPVELLALAERHGLRVSRVSIRDQQSRWGACSRAGRITLNWRLVLVPAFVREYVMLHELMHLRELNHSRRFWRHVAAVCPRYLEARRWLLDEGRHLF